MSGACHANQERMIANKSVKISALLLISFAGSGDEACPKNNFLSASALFFTKTLWIVIKSKIRSYLSFNKIENDFIMFCGKQGPRSGKA